MILNRLLSHIFNEYFYILILKVKLLPQGKIYVEQKILRNVCTSAAKNGAKGRCYLMMYGLLDKVPCTSLPAQGEQEWENRTLVMSKYLSLADNLDLLRGKFIQGIALIE